MPIYPEIEKLKEYLITFSMAFEKHDMPENKEDAFWVQFIINDQSWNIFISDEYQHFNKANPLICLFLVLSALEIYYESQDYLDWCKEEALNATNLNWLEYYKSLEKTYKEIKNVLGEINPHIPYFDYSLQTGLGKALLYFNKEDLNKS